jgi:hypothetical protein
MIGVGNLGTAAAGVRISKRRPRLPLTITMTIQNRRRFRAAAIIHSGVEPHLLDGCTIAKNTAKHQVKMGQGPSPALACPSFGGASEQRFGPNARRPVSGRRAGCLSHSR